MCYTLTNKNSLIYPPSLKSLQIALPLSLRIMGRTLIKVDLLGLLYKGRVIF